MGNVPSIKELTSESMYHYCLSDPIRLRILYALASSDQCPCVLKEVAGISDSKLSYHLRILQREGFIVGKREKNWRIYSITDKGRKSLGQFFKGNRDLV